MRDAARPGSYFGNVLGCCEGSGQPCEDLIAGRRVAKLRPNGMTIAPQTWRTAGAQGALRPEPAPYSIRGCPRAEAQRRIAQDVPSSETASEEQCSTPRPTHAAGRRLSLMDRHRESRARSVGTLRVRDGPSRFLGTKRWKSQKLRQLSPERTSGWKGPDGVLGQLNPNHWLRRGNAANIAATPYFHQSPRVQTRRTQRSSSRFLKATRVS